VALESMIRKSCTLLTIIAEEKAFKIPSISEAETFLFAARNPAN
jgi:hypothetical protein